MSDLAQRTLRDVVLEAVQPEPRALQAIYAFVLAVRPGTAPETIRARVYEHVAAGRVIRVAEGVYLAQDGPATLLMVHGDAWDVLRRAPNDFVDLIVTDPPYLLGTEEHVGKGTTRPHAQLGRRTYAQRDLDEEFLRHAFRVLKKKRPWNTLSRKRRERVEWPLGGGALVFFTPARTKTTRKHIDALLRLAEECGFEVHGEIVWDKEVLGMGYACGRSRHELIHILTAGPRGGVGWDLGMPTVLRHKAVRNPVREGAAAHEGEKPKGVFLDLVAFATRAGDVVLDPFAGAATWAEDAVRSGRHVVLVDVEERWATARATS